MIAGRSTSWRAGLASATLVALGRPALWAMGLATFLVRGGVLLVAAPIVVLPTVTGISNAYGADVTELALGGPGPGTIRLIAALIAVVLAWLVGGGLLAASIEVAAIRAVAADDELRPATGEAPISVAGSLPRRRGLAARVLVARLLSLLPLAIAIVWAVPGIIGAAYHELILPNDLATPIVVRVLRDVPGALVVVAVTWLLGETVGSLAVRSIVLDDRSEVGALGGAARVLVGRPLTTLATAAVGVALVVVAAAPALMAASIVWSDLRVALGVDASDVAVVAGTALLVATWGGGLVLLGAASAWRSAAWTVESRRVVTRHSLARIGRRRLETGSA